MQKSLQAGAVLLAAALGFLYFHEATPVPASVASWAQFPAHFEPGSRPGAYHARGAGFALELGASGARLRLGRGDQEDAVALGLLGATVRAAQPEERLPGVSNYFLGADPRAWRTGVPHYRRVRYEQVYEGIDLLFYGAQGTLEYDFEVAPGADPSAIRMHYAGATEVRLDDQGNLRIALAAGELIHRRPVSHQVVDGARVAVASRFRLSRVDGQQVVTFELGDYDPRLPLVIDPVLDYATYLGGANDNERVDSLVVDSAGALYVAGQTNAADFPVSGGAAQPTYAGSFDSFIAKLNPAGTAFEYVTYVGGSNIDESHALRVDAAGNAYLAGATTSADFPVTAGAAQPALGGASDAFVVKLSATGGTLLYGTYLGGSQNEPASSRLGGFAIDTAGNAYVYGDTESVDFPTTAGAPQTTRGNPNGAQFDEDLFLTRINAAGTALAFSTYHGGLGIDATDDTDIDPRLFAIDDSGMAWIAGTSESSDLPTTAGAFDTTFAGPTSGSPGGGDAFIAKFDTSAGTRVYSSYIGGTGDEFALALAVDGPGNAYLATRTVSTNFPVTVGAFDTTYGGGGDVGLVKLDAAGAALTYGTYLGGGLNDSPEQVRLDAGGGLFVAGNTRSPDFPASVGAADTTHNGGFDGFVARFNAGGALLYATFVGTSDENALFHLQVDAAGSAYVVVEDLAGDMPLTTGGRAHAGDLDDLVVKVNPAGSAFLDVSYLGGAGDEFATATALDAQERLYLGGATGSANYPVTAGAPQPVKAGAANAEDIYLARFETTPAGPALAPGTLSLSASTYSVGESAGTLTVTATRTGGSSGAVSATCATSTGGSDTATAGGDYTAVNAVLSWADGDAANKTCVIAIAADTSDEADETFTVALSNATGGASLGAPTSATVTIVDDDAPPAPQPGTVQFGAANYSVNENGGSVTLTLTRTLGADGAISVSVASGGGSATAGADYQALTQTVSWADGDSAAKSVVLTVTDDSTDEANETVNLALSNVSGGATLGIASAVVTLVDDDLPPPPPAPTTQTTTVQAKYGKGAFDALWLAALAAILGVLRLHRHRARRALLLASALAAAATSAQSAEGWYAGVRAGVAQSTQDAVDIERGLAARGHDAQVTLDDRHTGFTLFGGYRWQNGFALEAGFANLGEFTADVTATTTSPAALTSDTLDLLGEGGRAFSASLAWSLRLGARTELTPRVGAYYRESTREVSGIGRIRNRDFGVDLAAGLTFSWQLDDQWSLGLSGEGWAAGGRNDVRTYSLELVRRF